MVLFASTPALSLRPLAERLIWKPNSVFSDDIDCRANTATTTGGGNLPIGQSYDGKNQKAFLVFDGSEEDNSFPRWGQWT